MLGVANLMQDSILSFLQTIHKILFCFYIQSMICCFIMSAQFYYIQNSLFQELFLLIRVFFSVKVSVQRFCFLILHWNVEYKCQIYVLSRNHLLGTTVAFDCYKPICMCQSDLLCLINGEWYLFIKQRH